jgi:DNA-3-methyladenine glycosylase I
MSVYLPADGRPRCGWAGAAPGFLAYHDTEWGFPVADDVRLFETISLDGFQAGLSWRTILDKRDNFRAAFAGFDPRVVARYGPDDVDRLLTDAGIVRHRGKIEAVLTNSRRAVELQSEAGSLAAYFWRYELPVGEVPVPQTLTWSPSSVALSKDLKRRGWSFVGPTTVFAIMQAIGLVNDHARQCVIRAEATRARAAFTAPR